MYPLKFEDILRPMIWGGEEISRFKQLPEVHPVSVKVGKFHK